MAQFIACQDDHLVALAALTAAAPYDAIAAGVGTDRLGAELDLDPKALAAMQNHYRSLLDLHPKIVRTIL